jgi:hypothetical protein
MGRRGEGIVEWVRKHKSAFGIAVAQGAQMREMQVQVQVQKVRWWGKEEIRIRTRISKRRAGRVMVGPRRPAVPVLVQASTRAAKKVITKAGPVKVPRVVLNPNGDDDDGDEEIVELDPKRHPLLRAAAAGAIPKMSRAAVDAAVGLVVDDLVGQGSGASRTVCVASYTRQEARGRRGK